MSKYGDQEAPSKRKLGPFAGLLNDSISTAGYVEKVVGSGHGNCDGTGRGDGEGDGEGEYQGDGDGDGKGDGDGDSSGHGYGGLLRF